MSAQAIADQLNSKGVLSPMEYKKSIGLNFKTSFKLNKMAKWTAVAVLRILKNELYMGTMVQGRETTPNYKVKTRIYQPPEKWSRIANAHEADHISNDLCPRPILPFPGYPFRPPQ